MIRLLALIGLALFTGVSLAGDLPAAERGEYTKSFFESCLVGQRVDVMSKHLSEVQRNEYCDCASLRSGETLTMESLGEAMRTGNREVLRPHLDSVRRHCTEKLLPKWLPR
jgi:hypothetical protein